jgi:hypothetical protein
VIAALSFCFAMWVTSRVHSSGNQPQLDEAIFLWKQDPSSCKRGKDALAKFDLYLGLAKEGLSLWELKTYEWTSDSVYDIEDEIDDEERVEELADGAEPTDEELALWEDTSVNPFLTTLGISVWKAKGSDGTEVYFAYFTQGTPPTQDTLEAAGPYFDLDALALLLSTEVKRWEAWEVSHDQSPEMTELCKKLNG